MSTPAPTAGLRCDPLFHAALLPIARVLHPLGFPLLLRTNSPDVDAAAAESWGGSERSSAQPHFELRVLVGDEGECATTPAVRAQGSLLSLAADRENFGAADLERGFAWLAVSRATAARREAFRWSFLDSMICALLVQRAVTPLHASCVARSGMGALLCGPSGAGKSTLAFACALEGWTLISEDASYAVNDGAPGRVRGRAGKLRLRPDAAALFPLLAGRSAAVHPNGKLTIQVAPEEVASIRSASAAEVRALVALRRGMGRPGLRRIDAAPLADELLGAIPWFGDETRARHERTIATLARRGTWELRFRTPQEGVALLNGLPEAT